MGQGFPAAKWHICRSGFRRGEGQSLNAGVTCSAQETHLTDNHRMAELQFVKFDDVKAFELATGVTGRPLFGARSQNLGDQR